MRILLVSGSLRAGSTNTAVLLTAARLAERDGSTALLYDGMAALPHFNPDDDRDLLPPAVAELRSRISWADAILFCTPEYAGDMPGSLKNLLDWTVGGVEIEAKPVAWINAAAPERGIGATRMLRTVLEYTGGTVVEEACVDVPVARDSVSDDGSVHDPTVEQAVTTALTALARYPDPGNLARRPR